MALAQPFTTQSQAIASYNFTDVADGTGVLVFFGTRTRTDSAITYRLITDTTHSEEINTNGSADLDFDLTAFNLPRVAKGTAFVSVPVSALGGGDSITVACQLRKWDGSSETNITSVITSETYTNQTKMVFMALPITEHNFASGDVLRLNVTTTVGGSSGNTGLGHDPAGRDILSMDTTVLKLLMPFKIDI